MLLESSELKGVLVVALTDYRAKSKIASSGASKAALDGVISVLENLLIFITRAEQSNSKEEFMEKLQSQLVEEIVSLDDIELRRRSSELEEQLQKIIESLKPGQAALMTDKIRYGHLSTKISQMKSKNKIPDNIQVLKRGEKCYLSKRG